MKPVDIDKDDTNSDNKKHRKELWSEAKKKLRRNVKLRIKAGLYEDLRENPVVNRKTLYDNGG